LGQVKALRCRECGKEYPPTKLYICQDCFASLDVVYEYDEIELDRKSFSDRPKSLWRYAELLPIAKESRIIDLGAGYTPMKRADRLATTIGLKDLYIKDDTVNPTGSFKDRPSTVAVSKAMEFGAEAVGCASTGNLAAAVAAHAAKAGLPCYVLVPIGTELNKLIQATCYGARILAVDGTYDEANRLAIEVAETYNWVFANFNVRPYYVEGSKTLAFEVCEQLDWNPPDHVIVPTGSGALLCAIGRGFEEFRRLDLIEDTRIKISSAQGYGSSPIATALKKGGDVEPVEKPTTIAKSLAIGDPADGAYAVKTVQGSGGFGEDATDEEVVEAIKLLARTEGVFAEPAGGVTIACLKKLVEDGRISRDETIVCYITGNGFKATEAVTPHLPEPLRIRPTLESFREVIEEEAETWSR
jgi:threonine synthase